MKKSKILILLIILSAIALLTAGILILCGGEEEITYTLNDTLPDGEGMTARIILLGGQSNASGCSRDDYLQQNVSAEFFIDVRNNVIDKTLAHNKAVTVILFVIIELNARK